MPGERSLAVIRRVRSPRLESLFVATLVLFGFRLGIRPIGDNSMFTHLRTGLDMVAGRGIPRTDPYSFTALGRRWVAQSWLPEWSYGWAHRLGGFRLVVLEQTLLTSLLAFLVVRLARAGSPLRTALAGGLAVGAGAAFWSPRPLLFGLVSMAALVTVVERRRSPWLLVPLVWVWVQSHGSFPLGLGWLVARSAGEWLDWRAWPAETVRYVWGFLGGLALAVVNPLGVKLLAFPLTVFQKRSTFANIVEWQSPSFQKPGGLFALAFLLLSLAMLIRARVSWRDLVPVVVFLGAGLVAVRNLPVAAVVIAPVLGRALRRSEGAQGRLVRRGGGSPRVNRVFLATIVSAFVVFGLSALTDDPVDFVGYPVAATSFLDHAHLLGPDHRLANQDFVGNYVSLRYGRRARVFIDDRYDMFPRSVSGDYHHLLSGLPPALTDLDRRGIDVVLWQREKPLATMLRLSGDWRETFHDDQWTVYVRQA